MYKKDIKPALDTTLSLMGLLLFSWLYLLIIVAIEIDDPGPVFFKQKRVGIHKRYFHLYKFRSMKMSTPHDMPTHLLENPEQYITRVGAILRKYSLDELPQLVNVLKGDMSLVGPRPEIPFYVNDFKDKIPMYMIKHQVKPGMTGLAQINGYRGDTSIEKRIEFDVQYIENWNFFMDISILLRTAFSGFMNKEKLSHRKRKSKPYRPEKQNMNNKAKTDLMALAMFLPSIIALAFVPVILRITNITTTFRETYMYNGGTEATSDGSTVYNLIDTYSQGKALAVLVLAIIMIFMALICCLSLFRRIEKRSLVYVGASVVFVVMTLASAITSEYSQIAFSGEYDRAEGFWTTACYFVMFLFSMYAFRTSGNFRYLMYGLFFCVGVNFVLGVTQVTGHNLLQQEWFMNLIADSTLRGNLSTDGFYTAGKLANGALYHSNYMGSFTGLAVPLLTIMSMYAENKLQRVLCIVFDAMAVFLMVGSAARSGVVAVAAAFVVGIIVFARQIAKHWKPCLILVASAAVVVVGANFALKNQLFNRLPSLVNDAVGLFLPSSDEDSDLYSKLPLREISTPSGGKLVLTGQTDTLTVGFDSDRRDYTFTNSAGGAVVPTYDYSFNDDYGKLSISADYGSGVFTVTAGTMTRKYTLTDSNALVGEDGFGKVYSEDGLYCIEASEIGVLTAYLDNGAYVYIECDDNGMLVFTQEDGETPLTGVLTYSFPGTLDDVFLRTEGSDDTSGIRDIIAMYFSGDEHNSLFFQMLNQKKIQMASLSKLRCVMGSTSELSGAL